LVIEISLYYDARSKKNVKLLSIIYAEVDFGSNIKFDLYLASAYTRLNPIQ